MIKRKTDYKNNIKYLEFKTFKHKGLYYFISIRFNNCKMIQVLSIQIGSKKVSVDWDNLNEIEEKKKKEFNDKWLTENEIRDNDIFTVFSGIDGHNCYAFINIKLKNREDKSSVSNLKQNNFSRIIDRLFKKKVS